MLRSIAVIGLLCLALLIPDTAEARGGVSFNFGGGPRFSSPRFGGGFYGGVGNGFYSASRFGGGFYSAGRFGAGGCLPPVSGPIRYYPPVTLPPVFAPTPCPSPFPTANFRFGFGY